MARNVSDDRPQMSIFDRLLDDDPKNKRVSEVPPVRTQAVRKYKDSVARDLESLLNTRATPLEQAADFPDLTKSMYTYGLPDFSGVSVRGPSNRQQLAKKIQQAIQVHEPRLTNVTVEIPSENDGPHVMQLRFIVNALLRMAPAPEQVAFDTMLEISRGEYQVKGG